MDTQVNTNIPSLSVIVVIPEVYETIRRTMEFLKVQSMAGQIEIIFVVSSVEESRIDESGLSFFHSWRIVEMGKEISKVAAYAEGIRNAHAGVVALTEDHSFPDRSWAEVLINAHRDSWAAVGPSMCNANPVNLLSQADFYQAYGEWMHPVASGEARHLPGHNSSYKRDILLSFTEQLDNLLSCESILHRQLQSQGYKLLLEANTCTAHTNFTKWSAWIPVKFNSGRLFAATWVETFPPGRRLLFTIASPLLPVVRLWAIFKNIYKKASIKLLFQIFPVLLAGVIVEGAGYIAGIITGSGDSLLKLEKYEYHRDIY